ncbi:LOW QUALITY PROTEIN: hypothetical protein CFOL_v3_25605, partial [Cephalotus follicularis]
FWAFDAAIEAFKYCRPVTCVDGTHLYGKYKGKLLITVNEHMGWQKPYAYHRFCVRHLASNFNTTLKNKALKTTVYAMTVATQQRQFNNQWEKIEDVEDVLPGAWLSIIPRDKWTLLYDQGRYGDITINMVEIFNGVLKGAHGLPIT